MLRDGERRKEIPLDPPLVVDRLRALAEPPGQNALVLRLGRHQGPAGCPVRHLPGDGRLGESLAMLLLQMFKRQTPLDRAPDPAFRIHLQV
jgi:hypothetical protein